MDCRIRHAGNVAELVLIGSLASSWSSYFSDRLDEVVRSGALYRRPALLLLDEHTAALDPRSAEQVIRLTEEVVRSQNLTTLMVTHSMAHATSLGDRLLMAHQGRIIYDVSGAAKHRLRPHDLLEKFEELRRSDQLDETAARLLREVYV